MNAEQKIVQVLGGFDEASGAEIARFFLLSWNLYPALLRLERAAIVRSKWAVGGKHPWMPRRRLYSLRLPFASAKLLVDARAGKRIQKAHVDE